MRIKIQKQNLLPSLQSVSRSVGVKAALPVLANILLQTQQGKLKLSATNLEIGVVKKISCTVIEEGEITIPARTFLEVIQALPEEEIEIEASQDVLKITTKNSQANLNGISATEFPAIPLSSEKSISLSSDILKSIVPEVSFAAAADEGRPVLTGILTEIKKDNLELVATDGFRLARKSIKLPGSDSLDFKVLIPRRTLEEVARLLSEQQQQPDESSKVQKDSAEVLKISTSDNQNQIIFTIGQTEVSSRLIEGNFPSWEKIIPQNIENRTLIEKEALLKAVKLASVFARSESNIIKIQTQKDSLKLVSEAKELGGQESSVKAVVEGKELTIAFNSRFLIEALQACPSTQVSIEFSGPLSPALIKPVGEEGLEYVVMPIRLS